MLLQAFYSVHSERQLMERLEYDQLFRWFVELGESDVAAWFLSAILAQSAARLRRRLSSSVDDTLVEAWASMKSFRPRDEPNRPGRDDDGGRNLVERSFGKLKHFRAVATRFEKHGANYFALVKLAAVKIWMGTSMSPT